jgi:hypothetical protein
MHTTMFVVSRPFVRDIVCSAPIGAVGDADVVVALVLGVGDCCVGVDTSSAFAGGAVVGSPSVAAALAGVVSAVGTAVDDVIAVVVVDDDDDDDNDGDDVVVVVAAAAAAVVVVVVVVSWPDFRAAILSLLDL